MFESAGDPVQLTQLAERLRETAVQAASMHIDAHNDTAPLAATLAGVTAAVEILDEHEPHGHVLYGGLQRLTLRR